MYPVPQIIHIESTELIAAVSELRVLIDGLRQDIAAMRPIPYTLATDQPLDPTGSPDLVGNSGPMATNIGAGLPVMKVHDEFTVDVDQRPHDDPCIDTMDLVEGSCVTRVDVGTLADVVEAFTAKSPGMAAMRMVAEIDVIAACGAIDQEAAEARPPSNLSPLYTGVTTEARTVTIAKGPTVGVDPCAAVEAARARASAAAPPPPPPPELTLNTLEAAIPASSVDKAGVTWDPVVHSSSMALTSKGMWRARRGGPSTRVPKPPAGPVVTPQDVQRGMNTLLAAGQDVANQAAISVSQAVAGDLSVTTGGMSTLLRDKDPSACDRAMQAVAAVAISNGVELA